MECGKCRKRVGGTERPKGWIGLGAEVPTTSGETKPIEINVCPDCYREISSPRNHYSVGYVPYPLPPEDEDPHPAVLAPPERLDVVEPSCLRDAIENGLREAAFKRFGPHATADVVKRHMDRYLAALDAGSPPR